MQYPLLTIMFLNFWMDGSWANSVYTVYHSICTFWTLYSIVEPPCSYFRVITANFLGVRNFRKCWCLVLWDKHYIMILSIQTGLGKRFQIGAVRSGSILFAIILFAILSASFGCITLYGKTHCSNFRIITHHGNISMQK